MNPPVAGVELVSKLVEERRSSGVGEPPSHDDDVPPPGEGDVPPKRRIFTDAPRPEIVLSPDQPAIADAALVALAAMGRVYVRGRQLVHVVRDRGGPDWFKRPQGAPAIIPIEREHLSDLLGRAAVWLRIESKTGQATRTSPPPWVAGRLLARGEWELPQLESVSDAPVLRADGSLHDVPGYDERTRVIYEPNGAEFPPIPESPMRADARRALAELLEPFGEFPFHADCDGAACAALVLSLIGRAAVDGNVPMFVAQAPTPGSGKGLLVNVAAMIATGRQAPTMAPTETDGEMRKRLLAIAMDSPSLVVIDNVEAGLGSPSLAMALTTGAVTDRLLGVTKMATASLRPVWAVTGNNVQLRGDLGRRVVPIDLDPKVEHPEDRVFQRSNLLGYVLMQRERLVVAALTVLRAFVVAGCPPHDRGPPKGSFEAWDRIVRGAIIWAGGADPLGGVQRIRDQGDEDLDRLRTLMATWQAEIGVFAVTLAEAIKRAGDRGDLFDAFAVYCRSGKPEARTLGYVMRRVHGRMVNGRAFRRWGVDRNDVARWKIATADEVGPAGDAGDAGDVSTLPPRSGSDPKNGDAREDGPHGPHPPQPDRVRVEQSTTGRGN